MQHCKRKEKREAAGKILEVAKESSDAEAVEKFKKRFVKVTRARRGIEKTVVTAVIIMGMPVVEAADGAEDVGCRSTVCRTR